MFIITLVALFFYQQYSNKIFSRSVDELDKTCEINNDCLGYISTKQCSVFCANKNEKNKVTIGSLERTCDYADRWDPPAIECECVNNICK